ncbi:hypothetical protein D3C87_2085810 [compost metagenome]
MYDFAKNLVNKVRFKHPHLQFTIIQQNDLTSFYIFRKRLISDINPLFVANALFGSNDGFSSVNQLDTTILNHTDPDFRSL